MKLTSKLYLTFSIVVVMATGTALYGMQVVSQTSTLVIRLYDGPLMAVSHARSAQLHMWRSRAETGAPPGAPAIDSRPPAE